MNLYLFQYLSLRKIINLIKVQIGYGLSILFRRVIVWGYPYSLTIEPTNNCNLRCTECPAGNNSTTRKKGNINLGLYKKIINQTKSYTLYHMVYFQGEPFLHPGIFDLIKYANQNNIYTCTSTNGHFLSVSNCEKIIHSGLKKILISIDGTTQETYAKYRKNGDLNKVIEGVQNLVLSKQKYETKYPSIHLQFIAFKHNQYQIASFKKLGKSLKADKLEIKSAQIENPELNQHLIPTLNQYARYSVANSRTRIKNKLKNQCSRIWGTLVIDWEGNIVPCCFDKNSMYSFGNAKSQEPLTIWKSGMFNGFRNNVLHGRKDIPICRNCTEGLRIK